MHVVFLLCIKHSSNCHAAPEWSVLVLSLLGRVAMETGNAFHNSDNSGPSSAYMPDKVKPLNWVEGAATWRIEFSHISPLLHCGAPFQNQTLLCCVCIFCSVSVHFVLYLYILFCICIFVCIGAFMFCICAFCSASLPFILFVYPLLSLIHLLYRHLCMIYFYV